MVGGSVVGGTVGGGGDGAGDGEDEGEGVGPAGTSTSSGCASGMSTSWRREARSGAPFATQNKAASAMRRTVRGRRMAWWGRAGVGCGVRVKEGSDATKVAHVYGAV